MSAHRHGLALLSGDSDVAGIWTATQVRAYLRETNADVQATAKDLRQWFRGLDAAESKRSGTTESMSRFEAFVSTWEEYYESAVDDVFGWYGHVERAREFRQRLTAWREVFRKRGAAYTTPEPSTTNPDSDERGIPWGKILAGVAIGAGTYLTVEMLKTWRSR